MQRCRTPPSARPATSCAAIATVIAADLTTMPQWMATVLTGVGLSAMAILTGCECHRSPKPELGREQPAPSSPRSPALDDPLRDTGRGGRARVAVRLHSAVARAGRGAYGAGRGRHRRSITTSPSVLPCHPPPPPPQSPGGGLRVIRLPIVHLQTIPTTGRAEGRDLPSILVYARPTSASVRAVERRSRRGRGGSGAPLPISSLPSLHCRRRTSSCTSS